MTELLDKKISNLSKEIIVNCLAFEEKERYTWEELFNMK